jgi:hypothetical protein
LYKWIKASNSLANNGDVKKIEENESQTLKQKVWP